MRQYKNKAHTMNTMRQYKKKAQTMNTMRQYKKNAQTRTTTPLTRLLSSIATVKFIYTMIQNYLPKNSLATIKFIHTMFKYYLPNNLRLQIERYFIKLSAYFDNNIRITFHEFEGDLLFQRSKYFSSIELYLSQHSYSQAKSLNGRVLRDGEEVVLTMDTYEEVTDSFQGAKLWWTSGKNLSSGQYEYSRDDQKRCFTLTFHKNHKEIVVNSYLKYVFAKGKEITAKQRRRKLFSNNKSEAGGNVRRRLWSKVLFTHPATFETLAMEAKKKKEIVDDLETFSKSKEYYAKLGKPWKRGYLLYGPPGTGKSTMIAAMANFLDYDVYDLELTVVKDNIELKKLLIETSGKSIVVIEDIDCSLNLTGEREDKKKKKKDVDAKKSKTEKEIKNSEVTLSGLLNCIDGLWSTCGEERIFIFTTNYVDKLDPALIRRGRMDKHIELSYCCFESFKVLAKNYLNLDSHEMYPTIEKLLEETKITPADMAESLMPKSAEDDVDSCLNRLVKVVNIVKEEARLKDEEEKNMRIL